MPISSDGPEYRPLLNRWGDIVEDDGEIAPPCERIDVAARLAAEEDTAPLVLNGVPQPPVRR